MRQLEKFPDWVISNEVTWRQVKRSQTRQSTLSKTKCPRVRDNHSMVEEIVGTAMKVAEAVIKNAAITNPCGMTMHHGIGAMAGGGLCSQIQPAAAALGLSAGALVHLIH